MVSGKVRMQNKYKDYMRRFIQLLITILLFIVLFRKIDINNLLDLIKQISFINLAFIWVLSISFAVFPAFRTLAGFRHLTKGK